jgi:hypothetical protein
MRKCVHLVKPSIQRETTEYNHDINAHSFNYLRFHSLDGDGPSDSRSRHLLRIQEILVGHKISINNVQDWKRTSHVFKRNQKVLNIWAFTAVKLMIQVFWDVTSCPMVVHNMRCKTFGAFAKLWNDTISFVMSVPPSRCPSEWNNANPEGWSITKFGIWKFFYKSVQKTKV